jgi:hypothetical protein
MKIRCDICQHDIYPCFVTPEGALCLSCKWTHHTGAPGQEKGAPAIEEIA